MQLHTHMSVHTRECAACMCIYLHVLNSRADGARVCECYDIELSREL